MDKLLLGTLLGLVYAVIDVTPMYFMQGLGNKRDAMLGAFVNRWSIGIFIGAADFGAAAWLQGLVVGILCSLPSAIITRVYAPIMGLGIIGGLIIGLIVGQWGT